MRTLILIMAPLLFPLTVFAQGEFWCWDADEVVAWVDGDEVHLEHNSALLNCCPEPITYDIEVGDATIFVVERSMSVCDCDCCFNISMVMDDVPPGPWNLTYRWLDIETHTWVDAMFQIEVPDLGQPLDPFVREHVQSACLETTAIPGPDPEPETRDMGWGHVKKRYR